jgi:Platelet-activating factor acetylhydrolase, isoform II
MNIPPRAQRHLPRARLFHNLPGPWSYSRTDLAVVQRRIGTGARPFVSAFSHHHNSQVCTHLASSGKVVLAIEHRDGTSPVSRPKSEKTGQRYPRFYIRPDKVV